MTFTAEQHDLIIGTLLGDGSLATESRGQTWRYRANHAIIDKDYLFHKYNVLQQYCSSPPYLEQPFDARTGKTNEKYAFNTTQNALFRFYGNLFYTYDQTTDRFIKDVPTNIEKFLTPRAIAYWYMDDGSLKWLGHSNAMRISSQGFSNEGNERLVKALKNKFNIHVTLTKRALKNKEVRRMIEIPEKSSKAFRNLIEPYLVPCMRYKVSDGKKFHL